MLVTTFTCKKLFTKLLQKTIRSQQSDIVSLYIPATHGLELTNGGLGFLSLFGLISEADVFHV